MYSIKLACIVEAPISDQYAINNLYDTAIFIMLGVNFDLDKPNSANDKCLGHECFSEEEGAVLAYSTYR